MEGRQRFLNQKQKTVLIESNRRFQKDIKPGHFNRLKIHLSASERLCYGLLSLKHFQ